VAAAGGFGFPLSLLLQRGGKGPTPVEKLPDSWGKSRDNSYNGGKTSKTVDNCLIFPHRSHAYHQPRYGPAEKP
jgi:hypothetical protein